jgi:Ca2+/Na+ antiporter
MDAKARDQFRWKFYRLAVQLNIIVLLVAVSVLALFLIPERFRLPLIAVLLACALVLSVNFRKKYRETKAWLHELPDKNLSE